MLPMFLLLFTPSHPTPPPPPPPPAAFLNTQTVKKNFISPAISSSLSPLVKNIGPLISPLLTTFLRKIDDKLLTVVSNTPSPDPIPPPGTNLVNWNNAGRVEGVMKALNNFLANHITGNDSPGILTCGRKDRGGLDGLIDRITENGKIHKIFYKVRGGVREILHAITRRIW